MFISVTQKENVTWFRNACRNKYIKREKMEKSWSYFYDIFLKLSSLCISVLIPWVTHWSSLCPNINWPCWSIARVPVSLLFCSSFFSSMIGQLKEFKFFHWWSVWHSNTAQYIILSLLILFAISSVSNNGIIYVEIYIPFDLFCWTI